MKQTIHIHHPARASVASALPALLLSVALLTACSHDMDAPRSGNTEAILLTATVDGLQTRTTTDNTFDTGDCIAVQSGEQVKQYIYNDAGQFTSSAPLYWEGTNSKDLIAWYPASEALPATVNIPEDQGDDNNFAAADYLYAHNTITTASAQLDFRHCLTLLTFNIKLSTELNSADLATASITIHHPGGTATIDEQGTVAANSSGADFAITPHNSPSPATGFARTVQAVVLPGIPFAKDKPLITIALGGKNYILNLPADKIFQGGSQYIYNVMAGNESWIKPENNDGVPWTDGNIKVKGYDLIISSAEGLKAFADAVNSAQQINGVDAKEAKVLQTADIDLNNLPHDTDSSNWTPISTDGRYTFKGIFNGNGYTISNMKIKKTNSQYAGLFGYIKGVLIGIHLRNVEIEFSGNKDIDIGAIVANCDSSIISLCSATGKITANTTYYATKAGGIIGHLGKRTFVSRCQTAVTVTANSYQNPAYAGGIAGYAVEATIVSCQATGNATAKGENGSKYAGGIVGHNTQGTIAFCIARGNATAIKNTDISRTQVYAGGLVGMIRERSSLVSCYAQGTATTKKGSNQEKGGAIVGLGKEEGNISYCLGTGEGGKGTSDLGPSSDIIYDTSPGEGAIFTLMQSYKGTIEGFATAYNPTLAIPYGIELITVNWGSKFAWKSDGRSKQYPDIDMLYDGTPVTTTP